MGGSTAQGLAASLEREANAGRTVPDVVVVLRGPANRPASPRSLFWPHTGGNRLAVRMERRAVAEEMSRDADIFNCTVCYEDLSETADLAFPMSCTHVQHGPCFEHWRTQNGASHVPCPMCRTPVDEPAP